MIRKLHIHLGRVYARIALLSAELLIVLVCFAASAMLLALTIREIFLEEKEDLDHMVFGLLQHVVSPAMTKIMQFVTFFGSHNFLVPGFLGLIAYYLFIKRQKWYSIKIPAVAITSVILMFSLKQFFNRPRPLIPLLEQVGGLSFPSGHAFMSFTFFGLLIYIVHRNIHYERIKWYLTAFLVFFILLIGFSRIYLRVHYASDVVAGFSLGLIWLVISISVLRRLEKFSKKNVALDEPPKVKKEA